MPVSENAILRLARPAELKPTKIEVAKTTTDGLKVIISRSWWLTEEEAERIGGNL